MFNDDDVTVHRSFTFIVYNFITILFNTVKKHCDFHIYIESY